MIREKRGFSGDISTLDMIQWALVQLEKQFF